MLCDICHKNIATVHLTEIVNNKVMEMHICQGCAQTKAEEIKEQLSISDLLGGLVQKSDFRNQKTSLSCPFCGLTYDEFKKRGRLGCGTCYITFRDYLLPLLKKIHGSVRHTGKTFVQKAQKVSGQTKLKMLKDKLEKAIRLEEYEEAARLRDEIKELEKKAKDQKPKTKDV